MSENKFILLTSFPNTMEETNVTSMVNASRNFILGVQSSYSVKMCILCGYLLFAVAYIRVVILQKKTKIF